MASDLEGCLTAVLEESAASREPRYGVALHVSSPELGISWEGAAGLADPVSGERMTPAHPVRIASNTKTYVAAAVLRAWEDGLLGLDDPIARHLSDDFVRLLADGGYRPEIMTVRHLLTHTSGLDDHGNDRYAERVMADPQHRWSRAEQLRICVEEGRPDGEPGEVYRYSDTGYVLLGGILERITGRSLAEAVWGLVDREGLSLTETWFESLEPRPDGVLDRAHQFYGEADVTGFDPSFDLWGGGGIAATVDDLGRFTRALFSGGVYHDPATLETMLTTFDGLRPASAAIEGSLPPGAYRMGIWVLERDGTAVYRHTGFWCTSASYVPEYDLVVTATANQHEARDLLDSMVDRALALVLDHAERRGTGGSKPE
jgi:D-alanyl-D-alanine carboxypeptidase